MNEVQELQIEHYRGRAKNAVQDYLVQKLLYPKIYLDADLDGFRSDILAIDRLGRGDIHAVRLIHWEPGRLDDHGYSSFLEKAVTEAVRDFVDFPSHFRYLAIVCTEPKKQPWIPSPGIKDQSLAADGVGRVGMLYLDITEEEPIVKILLKAERFRSSKEMIERGDRFVSEHTANWEYREEY